MRAKTQQQGKKKETRNDVGAIGGIKYDKISKHSLMKWRARADRMERLDKRFFKRSIYELKNKLTE